MINEKQWDDYVRRVPGTIFGDFGREYDNSFKKQIANIYPSKRKIKKQTSPTINIVKEKETIIPSTKLKKAEPFFPEVDKWIDKHVSMKTRRIFAVFSMIIGAIIGSEFSEQLGTELWLSSALGAVAGLIIFPLIIFSIKLLLLLLTLAFAGLIFYLIYMIINLL